MKNLLDQDILKYTFMLIPFKIEEFNCATLKKQDILIPIDHSTVKYDRVYKHLVKSISEENACRSIYDFRVDENHLPNIYGKPMSFSLTKNTTSYEAMGYLKDIYVYFFSSGIGFIALNFVFDNETPIDTFCEILNQLKKIKRESDNVNFRIKCDDQNIETSNILNSILSKFEFKCDLFFQHNSLKYVSATMLNSFTYPTPPKETELIHYLECLKRSQGDSFGTVEGNSNEILHPFKNIYWSFSTQGIANINYEDPELDSPDFLKKFYRNIEQEYLLMVLIVLNQEYTLLDYCQKFTLEYSTYSYSEMDRLNLFKLQNTFSVVSHLEHYRKFYEYFYRVMEIDKLLNEVNEKQKFLWQTHENKLKQKKDKRDKNINRIINILTVVLSLFGITGIIENIVNLLEAENAKLVSIITIISVVIIVLVALLILHFRDKRNEKKKE